MRYYPLLLDLSAVQVLIAGAGEVGLRKARDVLACAPRRVLLLDPDKTADALPGDVRENPALVFERRSAQPGDVHGSGLVFAATGSREANGMLAREAAGRGIPCNVADAPAEGNFIVPAHFTDGDFTLAVSTNGSSPALAKIIRRELQDWYSGRYKGLLRLLKKLRPLVLERGAPTAENTELFRAIAASGLGDFIGRGDTAGAKDLLTKLLPPDLHGNIEDLLHGLS